MVVLDAQVHIWEADRPDRPWIPGGSQVVHLPEPLSPERLLGDMNRVGVDRTLLVSPSWEGPRNDVVLAAAEAHPDRFGAIMRFPIDDPGSARDFESWASDPRVYATRLLFHRGSKEWLRDGTADWAWPEIERVQLPVMIFAPGQYEAVGEIARRFPGLKLTICHMGFDPATRDEVAFAGMDQLLELSRFENVSVKATSLPSFVTEPFPFPTLVPHIRRTIEAFGSERVFWGSDLSRLSCSYDELYRFPQDQLGFLGQVDRANLLGDSASRWFGWQAR